MIPGTGPGRGVPWWRGYFLALTLRHEPGFGDQGTPRHGRLIATVGQPRKRRRR